MREFRDYLFALQEDLQFDTLADIAQDFISLRDIEPLTFSITRAGRVNEPISPLDDLTSFDAVPMAVIPAFVRDFTSVQEQSIAASLASTPNTQESLVTTQQSIVSTQQLAPTSQQLIVTLSQSLITEELTKPRAVQLQTLAEPFESARLNDEASMIPPSLFQETELQSAPVTAATELKPSLSLSNLQTVLPTVLQPTESIESLSSDELQTASLSPDNLQLDDFDSYSMKDNASFQLSERNSYDIQETGDFEQNSLVNQITNQTLFISNNEKLVKLPFTDSAAFLPKQSFTFDPSASLRVNDDFGESGEARDIPFDSLDNQSLKNPIAKAASPTNISLKVISEAAALRAIAIIEESLSQELEGRLA